MTPPIHATELNAGTGRNFAVQVLDKESMRCGSYFLHHSTHSSTRMRQRGLNNHAISLAVQFGECFQKQGLEFYALSDKLIPCGLGHQQADRARNTVVVIDPSGQILTCYRRRGGLKYLRKKPKRSRKSPDYGNFPPDHFMAAA